jgi:hypothetical protein
MTVMKRTNIPQGEWLSLPLTFNSNVETSANYELPEGAILKPDDMWLVVDTIDATETINVGIGMTTEVGYDADGFIAAYSLGTAGFYCVRNMYSVTDGSVQNFLGSRYIGALFFGGINGSDTSGGDGIMALKNYRGDGVAKTICYTCSAGSDTFVGRLIFRVWYLPL